MTRLCEVLAMAAALAAPSVAVEPADPKLSPHARKVLDYLASVEGKKVLTAISRFGGGPSAVLHATGRNPAITGTDIYGFHTKFGPTYHRVCKGVVAHCKDWSLRRGGLVTLHCHWGLPGNPDGSAWVSGRKGSGRIDLAKAVTPGTKEHKDVLSDLSVTADYLEQLADAGVPVLWRPLHEIDGSWFWWTDTKTPENTAALWRMVFDYLVNKRGIHNLIWVYNAAHVSHGIGKRDATFEDNVTYRKRFYPGAAYVDIASIDTYPNPKLGWGAPQDDARQKAYGLMQRIAPGKMLAVGEDNTLFNPDIAQKEGPAWVYCLAWFAGGKVAPTGWMQKAFNHEHMITLDELPAMTGENVTPDVRIETPVDGAELPAGAVTLTGRAGDRDGNLRGVAVHALAWPWRNWFLRPDDELAALFSAKTKIGEAKVGADGRWSFTWKDPPRRFHNVVAFARDAEGAVACSNAVRVTVGLADLARGKAATASSTSKHGEPASAAVDGDPTTMWWSDKAKPDPQWLAVDLGAERDVGGVAVTWWKAYAKNTAVEVSTDGKTWTKAAERRGKKIFHGDSDILRFQPVRARHVRLGLRDRAVTWQAFTVFEFRVYAVIP